MNDRDFKLLVREYFQVKSRALNTLTYEQIKPISKQLRELERKILSELEDFTEKEQKELPFKD